MLSAHALTCLRVQACRCATTPRAPFPITKLRACVYAWRVLCRGYPGSSDILGMRGVMHVEALDGSCGTRELPVYEEPWRLQLARPPRVAEPSATQLFHSQAPLQIMLRTTAATSPLTSQPWRRMSVMQPPAAAAAPPPQAAATAAAPAPAGAGAGGSAGDLWRPVDAAAAAPVKMEAGRKPGEVGW